jgi:hypothetical protein
LKFFGIWTTYLFISLLPLLHPVSQVICSYLEATRLELKSHFFVSKLMESLHSTKKCHWLLVSWSLFQSFFSWSIEAVDFSNPSGPWLCRHFYLWFLLINFLWSSPFVINVIDFKPHIISPFNIFIVWQNNFVLKTS